MQTIRTNAAEKRRTRKFNRFVTLSQCTSLCLQSLWTLFIFACCCSLLSLLLSISLFLFVFLFFISFLLLFNQNICFSSLCYATCWCKCVCVYAVICIQYAIAHEICSFSHRCWNSKLNTLTPCVQNRPVVKKLSVKNEVKRSKKRWTMISLSWTKKTEKGLEQKQNENMGTFCAVLL